MIPVMRIMSFFINCLLLIWRVIARERFLVRGAGLIRKDLRKILVILILLGGKKKGPRKGSLEKGSSGVLVAAILFCS
jgi:hypothetical protein